MGANEKWMLILELMDQVERLSGKYERDKVILNSHGISRSDVSSEMLIFSWSSRSRRTYRPSQAGISVSSACH